MAEEVPTSEAPPPPVNVNSKPLEEVDQEQLLTKLLEQNRLADLLGEWPHALKWRAGSTVPARSSDVMMCLLASRANGACIDMHVRTTCMSEHACHLLFPLYTCETQLACTMRVCVFADCWKRTDAATRQSFPPPPPAPPAFTAHTPPPLRHMTAFQSHMINKGQRTVCETPLQR